MRLASFLLEPELATYRDIGTTRAYVSYPFPPRTAILGKIGALLGLERDAIHVPGHPLRELFVAIQILEEGSLCTIAQNWRHAKNPFQIKTKQGTITFCENGAQRTDNSYRGPRTPQTVMYLSRPRWRIFVGHSNDAEVDAIFQRLAAGETHYPMYCGHANCFVTPQWEGEYEVVPQTSPFENGETRAEIITALPAHWGIPHGNSFSVVLGLPARYKMERGRLGVTKIDTLYFARDGTPLHLSQEDPTDTEENEEDSFAQVLSSPDLLASPGVSPQQIIAAL